MTPIAAYYVMVITDHERAQRPPRFAPIVTRRSRLERIAEALESLVRLGRPTSVQPV